VVKLNEYLLNQKSNLKNQEVKGYLWAFSALESPLKQKSNLKNQELKAYLCKKITNA